MENMPQVDFELEVADRVAVKPFFVPWTEKSLGAERMEDCLDGLLKSGRFADVIFSGNCAFSSELRVHRVVICLRSPHLARLVELACSARGADFRPSPSDPLRLDVPKGVDALSFKLVVEMMYGGSSMLRVSIDNVIDVLECATVLKVDHIRQTCFHFLSELTPAKACVVLSTGASIWPEGFQRDAMEYLVEKAGSAFRCPSFARLPRDTLQVLLRNDELPLLEVDVFRGVLLWGTCQLEKTEKANAPQSSSLHEVLRDVLPLVRFPLMTCEELVTVVGPTGLLSVEVLVDLVSWIAASETLNDAKVKSDRSPLNKQLLHGASAQLALHKMPFNTQPRKAFNSRGVLVRKGR